MKTIINKVAVLHQAIYVLIAIGVFFQSENLMAAPAEEEIQVSDHLSVKVNNKNGFLSNLTAHGLLIADGIYLEAMSGDDEQIGAPAHNYMQRKETQNVEVAAAKDFIATKGEILPYDRSSEPLGFETKINCDPEKEKIKVRSTITFLKDSIWTDIGKMTIHLLMKGNKDQGLRIIDAKGKEKHVSMEDSFTKAIFAQIVILPLEQGDLIFEADENSHLSIQDFRQDGSPGLILRASADLPWKKNRNMNANDKCEFGFTITYKSKSDS
ncbi:MAG: hypothetical protein V4507_11740 [Verrucomicrobiota bacterium]